ncbi:uncharacterized protein [Asterias amurensis]|uniref:uncharacterized protein n=1 Tax=Asterias amurensis TaxID=7602 RepID=UPI003AB5C2CE
MDVLIQRESSMCNRARNITGMTFFKLVVLLALVALARQSVARPAFGGDNENDGRDLVKRNSSFTNSTLPPYYDFSPPYCNFSIFTSESFHPVKEFNRLVKEGAIFVYLKLDFINVEFDDPSSTYLEDIGDIIDPLTWVWSKGGRGKLLLGAPFDFNVISLTTLSHGVFSLTVKINAFSVCNEPNSTDEDTLEEIKGLLQDMTKGENDTRQAEVGDDGEEIICLEKQLDYGTDNNLYYSSPLRLMEETSAYDCWQRGGDQVRVVRTKFWLTWIRVFGLILALFAPMAVRFFLQKNPPERDKNGVERLRLVSDLPIGLTYSLCNWGNNKIWVLIIRGLVFVWVFIVMEFVPYFFVLSTESYTRRYSALYRFSFTNPLLESVYYVIMNLFCFTFCFQILCICIKAQLTRSGINNKIGTHKELQSISTDRLSFEHRFQNFFEQDMIGCRAKIILSLGWLKQVFFSWPREIINCIGDNIEHTWIRDILFRFLIVLLYIPCVLLLLVYFGTETIPLLFMLKTMILIFILGKVHVEKISTFSVVAIAILSAYWIIGVIAWTYKLTTNFYIVSEVLVYTFMGTVINADKVGPIMIAILFLTKYVVDAITGFYDGYCILLCDVMKEAEALMDEADVQTRREIKYQTSLGDGGNGSIEMSVIEEKEVVIPLVKYDSNGIPTIELWLFWLIVEKYRPVRVHACQTLLQIIGIILLAVFWIILLGETDSVLNISTTVKLFSMLFLTGLYPLVNHLLNSPASREFNAEARKKTIRMDILNLMIYGKLSIIEPEEIKFPPSI